MRGMAPRKRPKAGGKKAADATGWRLWKTVLMDTWTDAGEDNLGLVAAGVAFYAFLAFVPLLTALVLSYGLFADSATVTRDVQALAGILPANAASIVADQLEAMTEGSGAKTGLALLVSLAIAVFGASKAAGAIMTALNIVYEAKEGRSWFWQTLVSLQVTAGALFALVLALGTISALTFLESLLPGLGGLTEVLLKIVFLIFAGLIVMLLLSLVYRYVPCRPEAPWKWITPGSAAATLIWLAATIGFGIYVANFDDYNATYGALGAVIVFLTWLYLSAYILLLGGELNAILEIDLGRRKAA
jgi:membrane protein